MERTQVTSRALSSVGYDPTTRVLEIEFSSGRLYRYQAVPQGVFDWLLRTPNKGAYISRMIEGRYAYEEIDDRPEGSVDLLAALKASLAPDGSVPDPE